jgi:predicted cupin superfamily sugar epimerase
MQPATYWIKNLRLNPHPEGGFYNETYRANEKIALCGLPLRFTESRCMATAIYFLLRSQDRSMFHRIKSDELWHFHAGDTLEIFVLSQQGLVVHKLGTNLEQGDRPQLIIPANHWFGAGVRAGGAYTLSSCTVAPGFDFQDFEMGNRELLLEEFPQHRDLILQLTDP